MEPHHHQHHKELRLSSAILGEISVGPALLFVFNSWRQSVNANIEAVQLKLFIMKSLSNAANKKSSRFAQVRLLQPRPRTRGTRRVS